MNHENRLIPCGWSLQGKGESKSFSKFINNMAIHGLAHRLIQTVIAI